MISGEAVKVFRFRRDGRFKARRLDCGGGWVMANLARWTKTQLPVISFSIAVPVKISSGKKGVTPAGPASPETAVTKPENPGETVNET